MSIQALTRRSFTSTFIFTGKPADETRKALTAAGFQFDGRSKQWWRKEEQAGVVDEEAVAQHLAA